MIGTRNTGWIGVDIGTQTVKLAQIQRRGGRFELAEALVIRRREPWQDSGAIDAPTADSSEELSAALSLGAGFRGRDAAVALTMSLCDIREINVPEAANAHRRELVQRELEAVSGVSKDQREFDYWSIDCGADKHASPENILVASISRDWTRKVAQDLSASKLVGQVLDVLPFSLARAIELSNASPVQGPVAAVDLGYRRATFCVVLHGKPIFVRCLRDAGHSAVLAAVSRSLSVTNDEAQKLLTDRGLPSSSAETNDDLQEVIAEVAAEPLQVLCEELTRTITFLRQQRRALVPQEIVLFGGGAAIRNIDSYLTEKLAVTVSPWSLDDNRTDTARHFPPLPLLGSAVALSALAWEAR